MDRLYLRTDLKTGLMNLRLFFYFLAASFINA
jgi:hypothetical protein